jgi:hypothetical protein
MKYYTLGPSRSSGGKLILVLLLGSEADGAANRLNILRALVDWPISKWCFLLLHVLVVRTTQCVSGPVCAVRPRVMAGRVTRSGRDISRPSISRLTGPKAGLACMNL